MHRIDLAYTIDDDAISIYLAEQVMVNAEMCKTSHSFTSGREALTRLQSVIENNEKLPDLILLDLNMPIMDGWQFLNEYTKLNIEKEIPLFVYTSSIDTNDRQKSYEYKEVKGFIQKPLDEQKLNEIIKVCSSRAKKNLHPDNSLKWDTSTGNAYHANGSKAFDKLTGDAWHHNGEKAYNNLTGNAYHSNGLLAYSKARNEYYDNEGVKIGDDVLSLGLGQGIVMQVVPDFQIKVFKRKISTEPL